MTTNGHTKTIDIEMINTNDSVQSRVRINRNTVAEYREVLDVLPPIDVVHVEANEDDGEVYLIADGWHRYQAHLPYEEEALSGPKGGRKQIRVNVVKSYKSYVPAMKEAFRLSLGANATHGLPRSNPDKRRAVELALQDEFIAKKSLRDVAKICNVSHQFIKNVKADMAAQRPTVDQQAFDGEYVEGCLQQVETALRNADMAFKPLNKAAAADNWPQAVEDLGTLITALSEALKNARDAKKNAKLAPTE